MKERETKTAQIYLLSLTLLLLAFSAMVIDASMQNRENYSYKAVSAISKLPPPAFSADFLEPRFRTYRDYRVYLYPKMQPVDYLGFVYAK